MRADLTKVRQVLFNLLSNANKFTEKGVVRLEVGGTAPKRQRPAALQNLAERRPHPNLARASWSAAPLRRFREAAGLIRRKLTGHDHVSLITSRFTSPTPASA
jgi:hypothetical protein